MLDDNKALVRRWYDEVLNNANFAAADAIVAPNFVINGQPIGCDGIKQAAAWVRSVFPDLHVTVQEVVAEHDRVVTRFVGQAHQHGEFLGVPPTGKAVTLSGVHVDRVANGRIAERWETVDLLSLLRELGATVLPPT